MPRKDFTVLSDRHKRRIVKNELQKTKVAKILTSTSNDHVDKSKTINILSVATTENRDNHTSLTSQFVESDNFCTTSTDEHFSVNEGNKVLNIIQECIEPEQNNLNKLRSWAVHHNITHLALSDLLKVVKQFNEKDVLSLPIDARTLLKTPRKSVVAHLSDTGKYVHVGLARGIKNSVLKYFTSHDFPPSIKLNLNIDGLPISKSSPSQFWPILGSITLNASNIYTKPFVIGVYHGETKPPNTNFLLPFVEEALDAYQNGIVLDGNIISLSINAIICDAPAKAFVTCIKSHTGFFGCSKCIQEGEYVNARMTFPETTSALRNDDSFKNRVYSEHHKEEISVLEKLPIGMVTAFPIDYMHLVCLGVTKRLIQFWIKGNKNVRLNPTQITKLSTNLMYLKKYIPNEFARIPRSLLLCDRFKATEYRQLLLYTLPILLKNVLPKSKFEHFLCLSFAIRILCDQSLCLTLNDYAKKLLLYFVQKYGHFYGNEYVTYNVHNLIHLPADVLRFGCLDDFSSFKFENYLQKLKNKLTSSNRPLEQLKNRLEEEMNCDKEGSLSDSYPVIKRFKDEIVKVKFQTFCISTQERNNCCLLANNTCMLVEKMVCENNIVFFEGRTYKLKSFCETPCDSATVGIFTMTKLNTTLNEMEKISTKAIQKKCMCFKISEEDEKFAVITLLHKEI